MYRFTGFKLLLPSKDSNLIMKKFLPLVVVLAVMGLTACEAPQEASDEASHEETGMHEGQSADDSGMDQSGTDQNMDVGQTSDSDAATSETETNPELQQAMELGLIIHDDKIGDGAEAKAGDIAVMHYTGWLFDDTEPQNKGDKFDSSRDRDQPFTVDRLGTGRVIKGWDLGVPGMKVGGQRTLIIPSELGYGERGTPGGPIPGGATLVFDVELLELK